MTGNNNFRIKDLPAAERPRERLIKAGPENLSNAELLAIILRTGTKNLTATRLAERVICHIKGLKGIVDINVEELTEIRGVGKAKAAQVIALGELTKRINAARYEKETISSAEDLVQILMPRLRFLKKEVFLTVLLDSQNQIITIEETSKGSLEETIVHPREVFREAVRRSTSALIFVHNHPGGDPEPSLQDIEITKMLCRGGQLLGIKILDHLIIGDRRYESLRERGII